MFNSSVQNFFYSRLNNKPINQLFKKIYFKISHRFYICRKEDRLNLEVSFLITIFFLKFISNILLLLLIHDWLIFSSKHCPSPIMFRWIPQWSLSIHVTAASNFTYRNPNAAVFTSSGQDLGVSRLMMQPLFY